jgi:energy-coupling factor transporter ATP-binding protein EcfA2
MFKRFPKNIPFYEVSYGSDFPIEQYFLTTFDRMPSKHSSRLIYDVSVIEFLKKHKFKLECTYCSTNRRDEENLQSLFVNKQEKIFVRVYKSHDKRIQNTVELDFYWNIEDGDIKDVLDWNELKTFERKKKKSNINLVKSDNGILDIEEFDLLCPDIDIESNYGKSFVKIHDTIIERLNKDYDKGIILLHGDPGTGKTTYIKYISKLIKDKEILFIPPSMAEAICEPSIIPFLMDHRNSILIIEDGERVISDREGNGSPSGVSNILNLTDGILGDCLGIQVVATFNMKKEKIDQALLRKGRLIAEHKFEKLDLDDTNSLLKKLGKEYVSEEGMILSDIYNIDVEVYKSTQNTNKIGFKRN